MGMGAGNPRLASSTRSTHGIAARANQHVSVCGVGELHGQSRSFFAFVPDFSFRTRSAYVSKEEAQAFLIALLAGAQRVSKCAALGHPCHRNMCEPARVAVRRGRVVSPSFAFVPDLSIRTRQAYVWKEETWVPLNAPLEGAHLVSVCVAFESVLE